ncbi:hypothetical protein QZH41_002360 [Actinostola sp. cb2023]|nr:hypothetical protein QZH41_002360 [Actinostola sp. cb2023]
MAQLRIVQQSLAQQQLNQKQNTHNVQTPQQLYQQQQQIGLMLAQMQQQLLQQQQQQQPGQAGRFPSPAFPQAAVPTQSPHAAAPGSPQQQHHKTSKPSDKTSTEAPPTTSERGAEVSQAKEVPPVSTSSLDERGKQASPAPQSRLTQWKQPLLPDPDQPPSGNDSAQASQWSTGALKHDPNPNISPRLNRMSESVSSRWGVDASPRLSADPPEFKPGVPWRPRNDDDRISPKEEEKGVPTSASTSPPSPSKQRGSSFNDVPLGGQYPFGIGSSPWQSTGPNDGLLTKASASSIRPPPGLNSQNVFPETSKLEEEHSSWVKNLIDGAPPSFAQNGPTNDFNFGQLSFPMAGTSWSTQDGHPLTAPDPKPWAAPGGPSASSASSSIVAKATGVGPVSGTAIDNSTSDVTKATNMGISSWSVNQPIPSAEEKLTHPVVTPDKRPLLGSDVGGNTPKAGSLSTWLVLRNIPPNAEINAIRNVCQQHGPLLIFQYNMRYGNSLIRYGSKDQAATMRKVLNGMAVQGGKLAADFATNGDIAGFFEQPVDWSANPFPANSSYGSHWSAFQNSLVSGQEEAGQGIHRPNPVPTSTDDKPPASVPATTAVAPPNMNRYHIIKAFPIGRSVLHTWTKEFCI